MFSISPHFSFVKGKFDAEVLGEERVMKSYPFTTGHKMVKQSGNKYSRGWDGGERIDDLHLPSEFQKYCC